MSAALEHAQWTELIGVNDFDHIVGSGIVVLILVAVSLKIKKHCSNNNSISTSGRMIGFISSKEFKKLYGI